MIKSMFFLEKFILIFIPMFFFCLPLRAGYIDINFLSFSDKFKTDSDYSISRTTYDIGIGDSMGKSDKWIWALSYGTGTFSDIATSETTFKYTDVGLKFGYFWTKQKSWFSTLTYNIESTATYNDGTSEVELRGTSIKFDTGYCFWPADWFSVALKLFYYAPTYKESVAGSTLTKISYTRAITYPSLSMIFSF